VVGVDVDGRVESMFHSEFHRASVSALPFPDDSFDLILMEYVLEHLEDPGAAFREMARVLKPAGHILLLTPNLYSYKSLAARFTPHRFHIVVGRVRYGRGHEADMYPTLYRCNTSVELRRLTETNGFRIAALQLVTNGPTWFEKLPVVFEVFHLFHVAIDRWDFAHELRCAFVVLLEKRPSS
jgi:ubiquinone/menaquinone biosynthesis C-methylase UbiE